MMNHKITALRIQKRNHQRVNVYLDGEFAFSLARIVAAWMKVGQEIRKETIDQLQEQDARESAYQRALKFISYRPRTEVETRRNLREHTIPEEIIADVIDRLKHCGLLSDVSFAQSWVENRIDNSPRSRRALAYELKQHGIDEHTIEQTLEAIDDEEMAYQAALKHARKLKREEWKGFLAKMYRHLSQRGFSYEVSSQAISRVWEQVHDTESFLEHEASL